MVATFILGRAGAGKTRRCLDAILAALAQPDDARRLILLVPEQASFQMERALALRAPGGGYTRAAVLSFTRLARQVFREVGAPGQVLTSQARLLALRGVVARCADSLRVLRRAADTSGFYAELGRLIEELLRENVTPEALQGAAAMVAGRSESQKILELARIYVEYVAWLGPGRTDGAAQLVALRERLGRVTWLRDAAVWVDGFAGFTGQELETLLALARIAREVTLTLLLDPTAPSVRNPQRTPDPLGLFCRTELTYQRLLGAFNEAGIRVNPPVILAPARLPRFRAAPALAALELGLAAPESMPPALQALDGVSVRECPTHRDELRAAARWILTQIADAGGTLRFRDFAVMARNLEPLAQTVAAVFEEYEIPYFLDRRRPMRVHPMSRLLPTLLNVVTGDFATAAVVRLLRTRLLPLSRDAAEQLENIVIKGAVRGVELWRKATWQLEAGMGLQEAFAAERLRVVAACEPLCALAAGEQPASGAAWAECLCRAIAELGVRERVEEWIEEARGAKRWEAAETHRLAWDAQCELLENLHALLGATKLTVGDVTGILSSGLAEITLGLAPPTVDQVLVSAIERSRHPDIKYAWLCAFNEGVFPARPADDTLLSTAERNALTAAGLAAPAAHRDDAFNERLLAYIALTRPSHGLVISYAQVGDDGEARAPSPLLADVQHTLPGLRAARPDTHAPPVCLREVARGCLAARQSAAERSYAELHARLRTNPEHRLRLDYLLRGLEYRNEPAPLGSFRRTVDARVAWDGSPSEVETHLQCPFKHYATYGLRLDPARGPQPVRWDLGDVAHRVLADVTGRALGEPGGVRALSDARWLELLQAAVDEYWRMQPGDLAQRRPEFVYLARVLAARLHDLVTVHAQRWRRGEFEPLYCERRFAPGGEDDALPALRLTRPDGRELWLHGTIDRVDGCATRSDTPAARASPSPDHSPAHIGPAGPTLLLVYDYKSTLSGLRTPYLTGARLQSLCYLLATRQAHGAAQAAGVCLAPLYPNWDALDAQYVQAASASEQLLYLFRPHGVFSEEAAARLDRGHSAEHSPVARMRRKKDGSYYARDDAVAPAEIVARLELAEATVQLAADGICAGQVDVAPLVERRTLACRQCDFRPVCRFDRVYNQPRAAEAVLPCLHTSHGEEDSAKPRRTQRAQRQPGSDGAPKGDPQ